MEKEVLVSRILASDHLTVAIIPGGGGLPELACLLSLFRFGRGRENLHIIWEGGVKTSLSKCVYILFDPDTLLYSSECPEI